MTGITIKNPDDVKAATMHGYVSICEAADARPLGPYKLITIGQAIEMAKAYQEARQKYTPEFELYENSDLAKWHKFFERHQP